VSDNRPTSSVYWACRMPDGQLVRCDDLPLEVYATIADKTGIHWHQLLNAPIRQERAGELLYRAACESVQQTPKALSVREFADIFELVEDDMPVEFSDGIPDPKADGPATTT
jgi:hypothetical protein